MSVYTERMAEYQKLKNGTYKYNGSCMCKKKTLYKIITDVINVTKKVPEK